MRDELGCWEADEVPPEVLAAAEAAYRLYERDDPAGTRERIDAAIAEIRQRLEQRHRPRT